MNECLRVKGFLILLIFNFSIDLVFSVPLVIPVKRISHKLTFILHFISETTSRVVPTPTLKIYINIYKSIILFNLKYIQSGCPYDTNLQNEK